MTVRVPGRRKKASAKLPLSISRPALLVEGSDAEFRRLIYRMLITESRLIDVRRAIARQVGVSGAQYSIMMAMLHLEGDDGIAINALASYLEVTGPHVTGEVRKLVARGMVRKTANPNDMRGVLVRYPSMGGGACSMLSRSSGRSTTSCSTTCRRNSFRRWWHSMRNSSQARRLHWNGPGNRPPPDRYGTEEPTCCEPERNISNPCATDASSTSAPRGSTT